MISLDSRLKDSTAYVVGIVVNKILAEFFDFNCTDFKGEKDVRIAYQKQMIKKWESDLKPPKWTGTTKPSFAS